MQQHWCLHLVQSWVGLFNNVEGVLDVNRNRTNWSLKGQLELFRMNWNPHLFLTEFSGGHGVAHALGPGIIKAERN